MTLSREALLERKASLEADVAKIEGAINQATADLHAHQGAIQQVEWDLEQLDEEA